MSKHNPKNRTVYGDRHAKPLSGFVTVSPKQSVNSERARGEGRVRDERSIPCLYSAIDAHTFYSAV